MTPLEIEARFAKYDERIAALEDARKADSWVITALIGSHPNLGVLLKLVRRAIQTMRDALSSGSPSPDYERMLRHLTETEELVLKVIAIRQGKARSLAEVEDERAQAPQQAEPEQER